MFFTCFGSVKVEEMNRHAAFASSEGELCEGEAHARNAAFHSTAVMTM
jgi:hypothetical protein